MSSKENHQAPGRRVSDEDITVIPTTVDPNAGSSTDSFEDKGIAEIMDVRPETGTGVEKPSHELSPKETLDYLIASFDAADAAGQIIAAAAKTDNIVPVVQPEATDVSLASNYSDEQRKKDIKNYSRMIPWLAKAYEEAGGIIKKALDDANIEFQLFYRIKSPTSLDEKAKSYEKDKGIPFNSLDDYPKNINDIVGITLIAIQPNEVFEIQDLMSQSFIFVTEPKPFPQAPSQTLDRASRNPSQYYKAIHLIMKLRNPPEGYEDVKIELQLKNGYDWALGKELHGSYKLGSDPQFYFDPVDEQIEKQYLSNLGRYQRLAVVTSRQRNIVSQMQEALRSLSREYATLESYEARLASVTKSVQEFINEPFHVHGLDGSSDVDTAAKQGLFTVIVPHLPAIDLPESSIRATTDILLDNCISNNDIPEGEHVWDSLKRLDDVDIEAVDFERGMKNYLRHLNDELLDGTVCMDDEQKGYKEIIRQLYEIEDVHATQLSFEDGYAVIPLLIFIAYLLDQQITLGPGPVAMSGFKFIFLTVCRALLSDIRSIIHWFSQNERSIETAAVVQRLAIDIKRAGYMDTAELKEAFDDIKRLKAAFTHKYRHLRRAMRVLKHDLKDVLLSIEGWDVPYEPRTWDVAAGEQGPNPVDEGAARVDDIPANANELEQKELDLAELEIEVTRLENEARERRQKLEAERRSLELGKLEQEKQLQHAVPESSKVVPTLDTTKDREEPTPPLSMRLDGDEPAGPEDSHDNAIDHEFSNEGKTSEA